MFSNLDNNPKIYITLPIISCEEEKNASKLLVIKNPFQSSLIEETLKYLLSIENIAI